MPAPPAKNDIAGSGATPSNAQARAGFDAMWENLYGASGLLGSTGSAADARSALGIGSAISFRNRVRNGNFAINQRVKSGTVTLAAGVYGHDGWKAGASGCTYTFAVSGVDVTVTISAGSLVQTIEGAMIEGGDYVMSWAGTAQGKIGAGTAAASGVTASSVTANSNLSIEFGTGTLTRVQLEPGLKFTPFERRPPGVELQLAQRYYWKTFPPATAPAQNVGSYIGAIAYYNTGLQGFRFSVPYPVEMRAIPTLTTFSPNLANAGWVGIAGGSVASVLTFVATGTRQTDIGASGTISGGETYALHMTASTEL